MIKTSTGFFLLSSVPCGGTHFATVSPQNASSPHLLNIRRPLSTCTWIIEAPPYQNVKITVWELQLASQDCSRSYLELQDSPQVKTPACWPSHLQALETVKPCPNQVPVPSKIVFFFKAGDKVLLSIILRNLNVVL